MVEAAEQPNSVPRPRTVLVAVNGSDASDAALLFALKSIISDQDTLIILHVRPTDRISHLCTAATRIQRRRLRPTTRLSALQSTTPLESYAPKGSPQRVLRWRRAIRGR
ncbi:hypothetical protein CLOP_g16683 [Closterium sp. NIES-67]|nr:hypothetical protein CLOP_g16683 [Closterium sp. NIES-67]